MLLITAYLLVYVYWTVNSATLFSILTVNLEKFTNYDQLNNSDRSIYISAYTLEKYNDESLLRWGFTSFKEFLFNFHN